MTLFARAGKWPGRAASGSAERRVRRRAGRAVGVARRRRPAVAEQSEPGPSPRARRRSRRRSAGGSARELPGPCARRRIEVARSSSMTSSSQVDQNLDRHSRVTNSSRFRRTRATRRCQSGVADRRRARRRSWLRAALPACSQLAGSSGRGPGRAGTRSRSRSRSLAGAGRSARRARPGPGRSRRTPGRSARSAPGAACSDRSRRVQALDAVRGVEGRQERVRRGPPEEGVEPAAIAVRARCSARHGRLIWPRFITPSGWGGKTLGPPTSGVSRPLAASAASRISSASSRSRACRQSSRLSGIDRRRRRAGPSTPAGRSPR